MQILPEAAIGRIVSEVARPRIGQTELLSALRCMGKHLRERRNHTESLVLGGGARICAVALTTRPDRDALISFQPHQMQSELT